MLARLHARRIGRLVSDNSVVLRNRHARVALERHIGAENRGVHVLLSCVHVRDLILGSYPACRLSSLWL